jgi:hypothetical protein
MDRLDDFLKEDALNDVLECISHKGIAHASSQEMTGWLQELKERRESELRPADMFLINGKYQQFKHIRSEFCEFAESFMHYWGNSADAEKPHTIEELIDLQMSCETMLAMLGLDKQQRREARKKVVAKNAARGYYKEDE